jgi:hypothetical protein
VGGEVRRRWWERPGRVAFDGLGGVAEGLTDNRDRGELYELVQFSGGCSEASPPTPTCRGPWARCNSGAARSVES